MGVENSNRVYAEGCLRSNTGNTASYEPFIPYGGEDVDLGSTKLALDSGGCWGVGYSRFIGTPFGELNAGKVTEAKTADEKAVLADKAAAEADTKAIAAETLAKTNSTDAALSAAAVSARQAANAAQKTAEEARTTAQNAHKAVAETDTRAGGLDLGIFLSGSTSQAHLTGINVDEQQWNRDDSKQALTRTIVGVEGNFEFPTWQMPYFRPVVGLRGWLGGEKTHASTGNFMSTTDDPFYVGGGYHDPSMGELASQTPRMIGGFDIQGGIRFFSFPNSDSNFGAEILGRYGAILGHGNGLANPNATFESTSSTGEGSSAAASRYSDFQLGEGIGNRDHVELVLRVGGQF